MAAASICGLGECRSMARNESVNKADPAASWAFRSTMGIHDSTTASEPPQPQAVGSGGGFRLIATAKIVKPRSMIVSAVAPTEQRWNDPIAAHTHRIPIDNSDQTSTREGVPTRAAGIIPC